MTRAAERLVVCGTQGAQQDSRTAAGTNWSSEALSDDCVREPADDGDGEVLRYRKARGAEPARRSRTPATGAQRVAAGLAHARCAAGASRRCTASTPSSAVEDETRAPAAAAGAGVALLRGSLAHRLLQSLPDIAAGAARRRGGRISGARRRQRPRATSEREAIADEVLRLLDDARFAPLFAPGSRAEVPIVGRLDDRRRKLRVSGQIDRLAVTPEAVLIADFKTNRPAPAEDVPPAYVTPARALPRRARASFIPDRPVRAALIWTEVPEIMELSGEALDAALAQVTSA